MNKDVIKIAVKFFLGIAALATGGTLVKEARKDAGKLQLKEGKK